MNNRFYISKMSKSEKSKTTISLKATLGQRVLSFRIADSMDEKQITPAQLADMVSDGSQITVTENDIELLLSRKWWQSPQLSVIICYMLDIPISRRFLEIRDAHRIKEKKEGFKYPPHTDNTDWEHFKNTVNILGHFDGIELIVIHELLRVTCSFESLMYYGNDLSLFKTSYLMDKISDEDLQYTASSFLFTGAKDGYETYKSLPSAQSVPFMHYFVQQFLTTLHPKDRKKKIKQLMAFDKLIYEDIIRALYRNNTIVKEYWEEPL